MQQPLVKAFGLSHWQVLNAPAPAPHVGIGLKKPQPMRTDMTNTEIALNESDLRAEMDQRVQRGYTDSCDLQNLVAALQICMWELQNMRTSDGKRFDSARAAVIGICDAIEVKADAVTNATSAVENLWCHFGIKFPAQTAG